MSKLKIALTGQMRSGKDSVAEHLMDKHSFFRFAFGDSLKQYAHHIFPDVPEEPKPRDLYQFMNVMRQYDEDVWVKHLANNVQIVEELVPLYNGIVITDVRQDNEFKWCKDNGFVMVRVNSDIQKRIERMEEAGEKVEQKLLQHSTENSVDRLGQDYLIENNGSLSELHQKVDALLETIKKERSEC